MRVKMKLQQALLLLEDAYYLAQAEGQDKMAEEIELIEHEVESLVRGEN